MLKPVNGHNFSNYNCSIAFPPMGALTVEAFETPRQQQESLQAGEFQALKKLKKFAVLVKHNNADPLFKAVFQRLMNKEMYNCKMQVDKGSKQEFLEFRCFGAQSLVEHGVTMIRFWLTQR